jgi:hypothetical protein
LRQGSQEIDYPVENTDADGFFTESISSLTGLWEWRAKSPKYLAKAGTVTLAGASGTALEIGLMIAGDANDDNLVGATDFVILKGTYGKGSGQPGYDDRADFTGDSIIGVDDFILIKVNFSHSGAPPLGQSRTGIAPRAYAERPVLSRAHAVWREAEAQRQSNRG